MNRPLDDRYAASPSRSCRVLRSAILAAALGIALAVPCLLQASSPMQASALFFPDLQADIKSSRTLQVTLGQEGLADSVVDVQNQATVANVVQLDLVPKSGTSTATFSRSLDSQRVARFNLAEAAVVTGGYYAGQLSGSQPVGGVARMRWVSGAVAAYEAAPAARDLILPLIARTVYSYTTILYAQNTDPGPGDNAITMSLFDGEDGSILAETVCTAASGETCTWDTAHAAAVFGPDSVGSNAPTGGWLGHAWFRAGQPIAVMAYGDEMAAQGSSAYLGRPVSSAATTQYLPLVRANYMGSSLIAIASASTSSASVTIVYEGASWSPSGADQTYRQQLAIAPRGVIFLDLSERGRGTRPSPDLPRGGAVDAGFIGSATITASGPVLAVVQDEQMAGDKVDSVSAYNAFGPDDLGVAFSATTVRRMLDYQSSALYVYNPGYGAIDLTVDLFGENEAAAGQINRSIAAHDLARIAIGDVESLSAGIGRGALRADGAFAALVCDERDPRGSPSVASTVAYVRAIGESHVGGVARMLEVGRDLQVDLDIGGTIPGFKYTAAIQEGECGGTTKSLYALTDPTDGQSRTLLRGVSIPSLTDTPHSVLVQVATFPGRPARDAACGIIEPMPGPEVVDTAIAWPVRLEAGSIAQPTQAPPTASMTPGSTATPTLPPSATPVSYENRIYLPRAYDE